MAWTSSSISNRTEPGSIHVGSYYAAVYADTDVQYTVTVSYNSRLILQDGQPLSQFLGAGVSQRYELTLPVPTLSETVTIQTSGISGTHSVYVGVERLPQQNQGNTWDGTPAVNVQNAFIVVPRQRCNNRTTCTYNILIVAPMSGATQFTLTANTATNNLLLVNGERRTGAATTTVPNYYRFSLLSQFSNVTVQLTTTIGNADLYCSYRVIRPSAVVGQYEWSSALSSAEDSIYFDWTDPIFRLQGVNMATTFYCAVTTAPGVARSEYSIVYTAVDSSGQDTSITPLSDGIPVRTEVGVMHFRYFSFTPSPQNYPYDIFFQLTAETGGADVYVRNDDQLPNTGSWQWESIVDSTQLSQSIKLVTISRSDPSACTSTSVILGQCTYRIAVYAPGAATRFVIVASTATNTYTQLLEGVTVQGVIGFGLWHYYSFLQPLTGNPVLTLSLTALGGNPDLFWSYSPTRPSLTSNQSREVGSDVIQFNARAGVVNIGVYGTSQGSSNYLLTASLGAIHLFNGVPMDDYLEARTTRVYDFTFADSAGLRPVVIDVTSSTPLNGVTVYVSVDRTTVSPTNYTWMSTGDGSTANTITIMPTDPMYRGHWSLLRDGAVQHCPCDVHHHRQ